MSARPCILVIAPIRPARGGNGLAMRVSLFVEAAEIFADVHVVVVPVAGLSPAPMSPLRDTTHVHEAPARPCLALSLIGRISAGEKIDAFRAYGRPSLSGYLSDEAHELVARLAANKSFGLVVVIRSYMLPLAERIGAKAALVLDIDEDEFTSARSQARVAVARDQVARAAWLMAEAQAMDRLLDHYQARLARSFISSENDGRSLRLRHPDLRPHLVRNAVTMPPAAKRRHDGRTLLFVGAFGHYANVDGIEWFAESVIPRFLARDPRGFRLVIAGAGPPRRILLLGRQPRVEVKGWFEDAVPLYARATIAIAPMRFGAGARTKIIEAAAHGVACVSHRASTDADLRSAGWAAGTASDFAMACAEALADVGGRQYREVKGRRVASSLYGRASVIADLSRELAQLTTI